eukprot:scaffold3751_cov117-Isochrysis_galbana.AAC.11
MNEARLNFKFWVCGSGCVPGSRGSRRHHHVAAVPCRENSRMIRSAARMRSAGSRVVARGRST